MSSSDSDNEETFNYGTPLEPFEEDEVPSKRRAHNPGDQYAVDDHGRRRFHGAFTGGFSAGHGNSVDTPEGFTPAAFKSSRADRGSFKTAAPEDFMDEEDRSEFGIAPRLVQTRSDFASNKRPHPTKRFHDGPIPGAPVLEQFVRAVPETAAVRLLRAMGWRPGRPVGERAGRRKTYGCFVPPEFKQNIDENTEEDDEEEEICDFDSLFPEAESPPQQKSDRFGLGYTPLSRHSVLGSMSGQYGGDAALSHLKMKDKGKKVSIRGQAFGVGALEEEDEDVYAQHDMSQYDFSIGGPSVAKPTRKDLKKSEGLEGFVKASRPLPAPRSHPPPALPRDYIPAPAGFAATRFEPSPDTDSYVKKGLGRHELSADERGAFLGEPSSRPAPAQSKSGPDDLIAKITGRNVDFVATSNISNLHAETEHPKTNSTIDNSIAANTRDSMEEYSSEEKTFMPFASDPAKQERYERFLKGESVGIDDRGKVGEWEQAREKAEFEQAKKLYRPLTGILKDRFTPGSGKEGPMGSSSGLSDQVEAARKGMYGSLTRTRVEWRPDSLVCKRFNVPDPYCARPETRKPDNLKTSYSIFEYLEGSIHSKESFTQEQNQFSGSHSLSKDNIQKIASNVRPPSMKFSAKPPVIAPVIVKPSENKRITVAELFLMEAEKERLNHNQNETGEIKLAIDKFDKMELYKSIFMSDSEDEDNDEDKIEKSDEMFKDTQVNVERNTSPPRGIFANLDFDKLNARPSKDKCAESPKDTKESGKKVACDEEIEELFVSKNGGVLKDPITKKPVAQNPKHKKSAEMQRDIIRYDKKVTFDDDIEELYVSETGGVLRDPETKKPIAGNLKIIDHKTLQSPIDDESNVYGPKIPEELKKRIESSASIEVDPKICGNTSISRTAYKEIDIEELMNSDPPSVILPRPVFRDKKTRETQQVVEVDSSNSDSWVDASPKGKKEKKKKSKKNKHKSKHKKKKQKHK